MERELMIYLDNAATTKPCDAVLRGLTDIQESLWGNPGSKHIIGKMAKQQMDESRASVAEMIGADSSNIIFTSGATESNNLAIKSWFCTHSYDRLRPYPNTFDGYEPVITSKVEHDSVRNSLSLPSTNKVIQINVDDSCSVDLSEIESAIHERSERHVANHGLISIMAVNNETGGINDIGAISEIAHRYGWYTHFDCTQALETIDINVKELDCDYASFSSHKIYGLKGTGALYAKSLSDVYPMINGGHNQERGKRGGTENVLGMWAFAEGCETVRAMRPTRRRDTESYFNMFINTLQKSFNNNHDELGFFINGEHGASKIINLRFDGVDGETLLSLLSEDGICVSAGSACRSREDTPSHVLTALRLNPEQCRSSLRVSFSTYTNTLEELNEAAFKIAYYVSMLRGFINN